MTFDCLAVGIRVAIGDDIEGIITAICITRQIRYEVAWWSGRERKTDWFGEFEIKPVSDPEKIKIGFKAR